MPSIDTADENRHIPPFLYVAKPSCMVAFDWPVTKVLSTYILLPQDFDYTLREECDWTPLETIDGFPIFLCSIFSFKEGSLFWESLLSQKGSSERLKLLHEDAPSVCLYCRVL